MLSTGFAAAMEQCTGVLPFPSSPILIHWSTDLLDWGSVQKRIKKSDASWPRREGALSHWERKVPISWHCLLQPEPGSFKKTQLSCTAAIFASSDLIQ
mmetsp:Transcript_41059/g.75938  ORF Transcript_41059/g.75938 Transcript_41059/m.75938 type:complete len:98 (+) Transcript_41059:100-393(+)